jgi:hypothetical protein
MDQNRQEYDLDAMSCHISCLMGKTPDLTTEAWSKPVAATVIPLQSHLHPRPSLSGLVVHSVAFGYSDPLEDDRHIHGISFVSGESKWWCKALHKLTDNRVVFHQQIIESHQSCLIEARPTKLRTSIIDKMTPFIRVSTNRKVEQIQVFPLRTSLSSSTRSEYGDQKSEKIAMAPVAVVTTGSLQPIAHRLVWDPP